MATATSVWIDTEAPHKRMLNAVALQQLYIRFKGHSAWAVVGTIGDADIHIATYSCESDAAEAVEALVKKMT